MKTLNITFIFLLFIACESFDEEDKVIFLFEENMNLDMDDNGFYHMELDMGSWQTIHRLSGNITDKENGLPVENSRVTWEASHYWYIGDTLGYIVKTGLTSDLQYVSYDTSYVTWFDGFEVPVVNPASYSNADGEVNTMFAPIRTMLDDTVTIWYSWSGWYAGVRYDSLKIVLE